VGRSWAGGFGGGVTPVLTTTLSIIPTTLGWLYVWMDGLELGSSSRRGKYLRSRYGGARSQ
jgi:hypothetical protein